MFFISDLQEKNVNAALTPEKSLDIWYDIGDQRLVSNKEDLKAEIQSLKLTQY